MIKNKEMSSKDKVDFFFQNTNRRASNHYIELRQELVNDFLNSGYFTSTTQVLIFKQMLKEIHDTMKDQESISIHSSTYFAFQELILGIKALFPESWKLVRYFKYYAGTSSLNEASKVDILNVVTSISKKDKSKFEKLNLVENIIDDQLTDSVVL